MKNLATLLPLIMLVACVDLDQPSYTPADAGGFGGMGGSMDRCEPYEPALRWGYTYEDGHWVRAESIDDDGEVETIDLTWDGDRLVAISTEIKAQTRLTTIERDANGQLTRLEIEERGGSATVVEIESRTDNEVRLRRRGLFPLGPFDLNAPLFDLHDHPALVEAGLDRLLLFEMALKTQLDALVADVRVVRTYEDGRLSRETYALNGGEVTGQIEHLRGDGIETVEYRIGDELQRIEVFEAGTLARTEHITDGSLTVKRWHREPGMLRIETDEGDDMHLDHRTTIVFNVAGQRVLKQEDEGADGVIDWQKRYVYDADGLRTYEARDSNVDGWIDERWDYKYDEQGRLMSELLSQPRVGDCGAEW